MVTPKTKDNKDTDAVTYEDTDTADSHPIIGCNMNARFTGSGDVAEIKTNKHENKSCSV